MFERYGAKKRLKKSLERFDHSYDKIGYLQRILSEKKKKIVTEPIRNAAYSLMGDIYLGDGKKEFYRHENSDKIERAIRSYIEAGELLKAENLIGRTFRYRPDRPEESGFPALVAIAIGSEDYNGKELINLIKEKRASKRGKNLAQKIAASILITGGFVFLALQDLGITGNFIGSSMNPDLSFFIPVGLMIIGGFLLFKSFNE